MEIAMKRFKPDWHILHRMYWIRAPQSQIQWPLIVLKPKQLIRWLKRNHYRQIQVARQVRTHQLLQMQAFSMVLVISSLRNQRSKIMPHHNLERLMSIWPMLLHTRTRILYSNTARWVASLTENVFSFFFFFPQTDNFQWIFCNLWCLFDCFIQNGSLQLSPASHSLLKNQQIILNGAQQRIVVPKINIRMDGQQTQGNILNGWLFVYVIGSLIQCKTVGFGLPPTPPSSLSSEDSEDNQSAEMHTIPSSPASSISSFSPNSSQMQSSPQQTITTKSLSGNGGSPNSSRGYSTSSSRQPIHTPLISNQPVLLLIVTCIYHYQYAFGIIKINFLMHAYTK